MAFLRRLLGGKDQPVQSDVRWFDVPTGGSFEVAGVAHHKQDIAKVIPPVRGDPQTLEVPAVLSRDPDNEHRPERRRSTDRRSARRLCAAWRLPRHWSSFLARLEREGSRGSGDRPRLGRRERLVRHPSCPAERRLPHSDRGGGLPAGAGENRGGEAAKKAEREAARSERAEVGPARRRATCPGRVPRVWRAPSSTSPANAVARPSTARRVGPLGVRVQASKTAITVEVPRRTTAPRSVHTGTASARGTACRVDQVDVAN